MHRCHFQLGLPRLRPGRRNKKYYQSERLRTSPPTYSSECIIQLEFQTGPSLSAGKLRQDSNLGFMSWPPLKAFCRVRVFPR